MKLYLFFSLICAAALPISIRYFHKRKYKRKLRELEESVKKKDYYYDIINTNYNNFNCREHIYNQTFCSPTCAAAEINRLEKFVSSAKKSISLCMYIQTLKQVQNALVKAHRRGLQVRLISDITMLKERQSKSHLLQRFGIKIDTFLLFKSQICNFRDSNQVSVRPRIIYASQILPNRRN